MDALDVGILREIMRDRVVVWGSNDPRLSAEAIARRVKADPTTVRDRLRAWHKSGFLLGFTVIPNTALFGAGLASAAARVPDPRAKRDLIAALPKLEGLLGMLDHVGEWVGLGFLDESQESLDRVVASVAALPGVAEITPPFRLKTPACGVDLTPLDWRVVDALRRHPRESLAAAAKEVGISTRTFTRRYERLVEGRALWSFGLFDFGRTSGSIPVHLVVTLDTEQNATGAAKALTDAFPQWYSWHVISPEATGGAIAMLDGYVFLDSVGELEDLQVRMRELAGVADVETFHPLRQVMFGDWVEPRIAAHLRA